MPRANCRSCFGRGGILSYEYESGSIRTIHGRRSAGACASARFGHVGRARHIARAPHEHFERNGWPDHVIVKGPMLSENRADGKQVTGVQEPHGSRINPNDRFETNLIRTGQRGSANIQEIVQAVLQALDARQNQPDRENTVSAGANEASPLLRNGWHGATSQNWNQVKFTAKLISQFAGKEDENVITWLDRISSIGRLYQVADEVLVLAAVNQLSGRALA